MAYKPNEMQEKEVPAKGTTTTAKVEEINEGILRDFVSDEVLKGWEKANPETPTLQVIAMTPEGFPFKTTMTLPSGNEVHPASKMAMWRRLFGDYPDVEQEIKLVADGKGFWALPQEEKQ